MMQKRGHAMGLRSLFYLRKVVFYLKILCDAWYKKINSLSLSLIFMEQNTGQRGS